MKIGKIYIKDKKHNCNTCSDYEDCGITHSYYCMKKITLLVFLKHYIPRTSDTSAVKGGK